MFCVLLCVTLCSFCLCSRLDGECGGGGGLVALFGLSSWCLMVVMWLFLAVPWVCLRFVVAEFPCHVRLLFLVPLVFEDKCHFTLFHSIHKNSK